MKETFRRRYTPSTSASKTCPLGKSNEMPRRRIDILLECQNSVKTPHDFTLPRSHGPWWYPLRKRKEETHKSATRSRGRPSPSTRAGGVFGENADVCCLITPSSAAVLIHLECISSGLKSIEIGYLMEGGPVGEDRIRSRLADDLPFRSASACTQNACINH